MLEYGIAIAVAIAFILSGVIFGRLICGKVCPVGLLQDLLFRIPLIQKIRSFGADRFLRYFKYVVLVLWLLNSIFGGAQANTISWDPAIVAAAISALLIIVTACIVISRPFCKYLCPGAVLFGLFNLLPFNTYGFKQEKCTGCTRCSAVCVMDIDPTKNLKNLECIRCGRCVKVCYQKALSVKSDG
jgi:polyferredoxin